MRRAEPRCAVSLQRRKILGSLAALYASSLHTARASVQPTRSHLDSVLPWPFNQTIQSAFTYDPGSLPLTPSKDKVAVLMTGNMRSLDFFVKSVLSSYFKYFNREGYDLFLVTSEKLDPMAQEQESPRLLTERDWVSMAEIFGGTIKKVDLVTTPYTFQFPGPPLGNECRSTYYFPHIPAAKVTPFKATKGNGLGMLLMLQKFSVAFASMRAEEIQSGVLYDYVFRHRPDTVVCRPLPDAAAMFTFYRDSRSTGAAYRGDVSFGGRHDDLPDNAPLLADIVTFDDQFALMPRSSADAYFLGMQKVTTKCYGASDWSIACGIPLEQAVQRLNTVGKAGAPVCREIRLVSVEFNLTIRDCGDSRSAQKNRGICEVQAMHIALLRDEIGPLITTDHWNGGKLVCNATNKYSTWREPGR